MRLCLSLLATLLIACPSGTDGFAEGDDDDSTGAPEYEGDESGECTDGADNDQDGLFDCDDEGCAGSPDCADDDDAGPDDDDAAPDDDDAGPDDDDAGPDDDDAAPDDDDAAPDDDDAGPDDDDAGPDDDDAGPDDDDIGPDDDDSAATFSEGDLVITELHINPSGNDDGREWIELYNASGADISLEFWAISDFGGDVAGIGLPLVVPAGEYFVAGVSTDQGFNGGTPVDFAYGPNMLLDEPEDEVVLVDPTGSAIDFVSYDGSWGYTEGISWSLDPSALDATSNDDASNWCNSSAPAYGSSPDQGTPGAANPPCVPGDDDDAADDDDVAPDDDDTLPPNDDDSAAHDDDDSVVHDDDDSVVHDDDDSFVPDDDDTLPPDDDDTLPPNDDDSAVADDDDAAPNCSTDSFDGNQSVADAPIIAEGSFSGLQVCLGEDDWYAVILQAGWGIDVTASFDHGEGDIQLSLEDELEQVLVDSVSATDDELVGISAPVTGTYYIHVELAADTGSVEGNGYLMDIVVDTGGGPGGCTADPFEPNNFMAEAYQVYVQTWTGLYLCPTDDDWYSIDVAATDGLTFEVDYDDAEGAMSAELYDPAGNLLSTYPGLNGAINIGYTAVTGGLHTVRLILDQDLGTVGGTTYDFTGATGGGCPADELEPNSEGSPRSIPAYAELESLHACPAADDWYTMPLEPGDSLDMSIIFDTNEGDLDLFLRDPTGATVASSVGSGSPESFSYTASMAGDYTMGVVLAADAGPIAGADYVMAITLDPAVPSCANGDALEEDDVSGAATVTADLVVTGLSSCPGDDDWFEITSPGASAEILATFSHAEGNIDLFLLDSGFATIASSTSGTNDEAINQVLAVGTYYLQVVLTSDNGSVLGNTYDLDLIAD